MRRKIINAIDDGQGNGNVIAKEMIVLQAILMPYKARMKVTTSCTVNCFKKAGIRNNEPLEFDLYNEPADFSGLKIDNETVNEWLDVDNNSPVCHVMNDDKIVVSVSHKKKDIGVLQVNDEDRVE